MLTARQAAVLGWWEAAAARLPWRQTRDAWEVLVCEVMAQQTQVARVAERWRPFLERFPTPAALAAVPAAEVIRWWSGLGLQPPRPRPAPHRAAVVRDHDGRLPADLDRAARAPRHRALHGARGAGLRVRSRPRGRRHEHGPGPRPLERSTRSRQGGAGGGRRRRARPAGVGVEPGDARPRCHGVHPSSTAVRRVPRRARLRVAPGRPAGARSGRRLRRRVGRPVPLRGQRPPGPRPPGRGAQIAGRRRHTSWRR